MPTATTSARTTTVQLPSAVAARAPSTAASSSATTPTRAAAARSVRRRRAGRPGSRAGLPARSSTGRGRRPVRTEPGACAGSTEPTSRPDTTSGSVATSRPAWGASVRAPRVQRWASTRPPPERRSSTGALPRTRDSRGSTVSASTPASSTTTQTPSAGTTWPSAPRPAHARARRTGSGDGTTSRRRTARRTRRRAGPPGGSALTSGPARSQRALGAGHPLDPRVERDRGAQRRGPPP